MSDMDVAVWPGSLAVTVKSDPLFYYSFSRDMTVSYGVWNPPCAFHRWAQRWVLGIHWMSSEQYKQFWRNQEGEQGE